MEDRETKEVCPSWFYMLIISLLNCSSVWDRWKMSEKNKLTRKSSWSVPFLMFRVHVVKPLRAETHPYQQSHFFPLSHFFFFLSPSRWDSSCSPLWFLAVIGPEWVRPPHFAESSLQGHSTKFCCERGVGLYICWPDIWAECHFSRLCERKDSNVRTQGILKSNHKKIASFLITPNPV